MTEDHGDLVGRIPLFAELSEEQRDAVARLFFRVQRGDGDVIVAEGDDSVANFYVITAGRAVVTAGGGEVSRLGPGDYFGEMALTRRRPRSATVTAAGPVEMLAISGWNFAQLLATDPGISRALEQAVADHIALDSTRTAG
jgi:CRP-like cAMP-binding protein